MDMQPKIASNLNVIQSLAQGINDPHAKVKIMYNLKRLNKSSNVGNKLKKQYDDEVRELTHKIIASNKEKKINNSKVSHNNNGLDEYSKFRLNGLRKILKYD